MNPHATRWRNALEYLLYVPPHPDPGVGQNLQKVTWRTYSLALVAALSAATPGRLWPEAMVLVTIVFISGRPFKLRFDLPVVASILFAIWTLLSTLWSLDPGVTLYRGGVVTMLAIVFIGVRDGVRTRQQLLLVVGGYLTGCCVLVLRVIVLALTRPDSAKLTRLNLPDVNANYTGYALALGCALIMIVYFATTPKRALLAGILAVGILMLCGLLLVDTRAAIVGVVMLGIWVGISWFLRKPPLRILGWVVASAAVLIAVGAIDSVSLIFERLLGRATGDWSGRLEIWPEARKVWLDNFFVGTGASTFRLQNDYKIGAHSIFLELGTGLGIVGVALLVLLVWAAFRGQQRPLFVGAILLASAVAALTGEWGSSIAGWLGLAIASRAFLLDDSRQYLRKPAHETQSFNE